MPYYRDLSKRRRQRKHFSIGWLDWRHPFDTGRPPKWLIRKLWVYCKYVFNPSRGYHYCDLAHSSGPGTKLHIHNKAAQLLRLKQEMARIKIDVRFPPNSRRFLLARLEDQLRVVERGYSVISHGIHPDTGERIRLGHAEIYVFGEDGKIYVAPNLIYHYVTVHHYKPPAEFLRALKRSPSPPGPEYLACLEAIGFPRPYVLAYEPWGQEMKRRKDAVKTKSR